MKKQTPVVVISLILSVVGIVLLLVSMFGDQSSPISEWALPGALFCIVLANALIFIRVRQKQKEEQGKDG